MKLSELFEMVTTASVGSGDIGTIRSPLFKRVISRQNIVDTTKILFKKKPIKKVKERKNEHNT